VLLLYYKFLNYEQHENHWQLCLLISSSKQKKRSSNDSKENFTANQLMYVQQHVNYLFVPGSSSALPGPSHLVAAAPVSARTLLSHVKPKQKKVLCKCYSQNSSNA
jgi:hypothetical protein